MKTLFLMENKGTAAIIEKISVVVISITVFLLPVLFLTNTTDFFILPKQVLIISSAIVLLILWGLKSVAEKRIVFNNNPLNLPMVLFGVIIAISSIISLNRYDSLAQAVPVVAGILLFFLIANTVKDKRSFSLTLSAFVLGAAASSVITVLYYFNVYFLPIPAIQNQFFNTMGSTVQQLLYLIPVLVFCLFYLARKLNFPKFKLAQGAMSDIGFFVQGLTFIALLAGIVLIAYEIVALPTKPIILPYVYGFQTAFASISQDAQRFIASLLFGSGYGTFLVDFTRFKLPSFNLEQNIWNLNFSFSSSYFLELVATTGILGAFSFLFMIFSALKTRAPKNPIYIALFVMFILSLILPFSFVLVVALFVLSGIYVSYLNIEEDKRVFDVSLSIVTNKKSIFSFATTPEEQTRKKTEGIMLPIVTLILILIISGFIGLFTYKFISSDMVFAQSLILAQQNNGQQTYDLQTKAINEYPYRSDYHRIFSQVNVALANSIASGVEQGSSPSAEVQQSIVTLLQQGINSGRNAVILSPQSSTNWQNLAQVYRSLIGVGQNAEQFAVASMNQAIALDPYNPQLYIALGGIYYQLQDYQAAQNQFQVAINLKRDFANAYYNLGHTLEQQGDLQNALAAYQIVKQLSEGNQANVDTITTEIKTLEDKIGTTSAQTNQQAEEVSPETEQTPLGINGPSTQIPPQDEPIKISPPPGDEQASSSANK